MSEEFVFNKEKGTIANKRLGLRSFVLGARQWNSLVQSMYEKFGSAAQAILLDAGKSYGSSSAALETVERETTGSNVDLTIDLLSREAEAAGWGKVTITHYRASSREIVVVKVESCVFCAGAVGSDQKQVGCFFLKGVISGFAKTLFSPLDNKVEETHCELDYCEFTVKLFE